MKYCDLVMKGGITSGIVYPNAVLALSRNYRFKNIGGTSAGAIAAAASAAAAYGDRRKMAGETLTGDPGQIGFDGLALVAGDLAKKGFIRSLFQPASGARRAFALVIVLAGHHGRLRKWSAAALSVPAIAPLETLAALVSLLGLAWLVAGWSGVWASLLPVLACAYAIGAVAALKRVARVVRRNLLGLCSGLSSNPSPKAGKPALTEWLHVMLQSLAGRPLSEPLTFGDLWQAPRYPEEPRTEKSLSLQMITTAISHHEPRTVPFSDGRFWFRRDEFEKLFPAAVVASLVAGAGEPDQVDGVAYYRLPQGGDLPVLVGMRMSLSFPLLISAVPLHEPDARERHDAAALGAVSSATISGAGGTDAGTPGNDRDTGVEAENTVLESTEALASGGRSASGSRITRFRVCWFSDGGISSNFPIHLFDAPVPTWPTFAINLVYPDTDDTSGRPPVWLPGNNNAGWQRSYLGIARRGALAELGGFLFGIVGTMQNWRDLMLARAPGQRDHIVHVALSADEGGMNLDMPQAVLDRISDKGSQAGEAFAAFSFDNHYWVRWRNLSSAMQRFSIRLADSLESSPPIADYADAYATARTGSPPPVSYVFRTEDRRLEAERLLRQWAERGAEWKDLGPDITDGAPRPTPQLQVTPVF